MANIGPELPTKTVDLSEFGMAPVTLKGMTFGKICDWYDNLKKHDMGQGYSAYSMLANLICEAPFEPTEENIKNLDPRVAVKLLKAGEELIRPLEETLSLL